MARYYEETALIEFVKQYTPHINGETTMKCVERAIREAPTADVAPKSEIERLKAELDWIQARHPFAMTLFELEACEKHAAIKAVKEVWRELRSKCDAPHWCVWLSEIDEYFEKKTGVKTEDIAEFKKKYTEERENDKGKKTE